MKFKTFVSIEQEVEVNASAEDIATALLELQSHSVKSALYGINNCATFLKGVPEAIIKDMTSGQKEIVYNFLREQAARYITSARAQDNSQTKDDTLISKESVPHPQRSEGE